MSNIIESLRTQAYNIIDTDKPNIKHYPIGNGFLLIMDTQKNTDKWHAEKEGKLYALDELQPLECQEAKKFIQVYNLEKLDDVDFKEESPLDKLEQLDAIMDGKAESPKQTIRKPVRQEKPIQRMPATIPQNMRSMQIQELSIEDIKHYICPTATDQEAFMFLKLCQARNLNPFLNEAYLIKYGDKATMTVGKEAFTRRAEEHQQFDGYEAGIIIQNPDKTFERREGTFLLKNEILVGGWAKIYRRDRKQSFVSEVAFHEYNTGKSLWVSKPATMIRKVAIVQGLREAFPSEFSGMYDPSEVGVNNPEIFEAQYQEVEETAF